MKKQPERQEGRQGNQDNFYRSEIDSNRMRDENMFLGADRRGSVFLYNAGSYG